MDAAIGSGRISITSIPAASAAFSVSRYCFEVKYAGTVITAAHSSAP